MARRNRIWKINTIILIFLALIISFLILLLAKNNKPIKNSYDDILSTATLRGSFFGKIIEKVASPEGSENDINKKFQKLVEDIKDKNGTYGIYIKDFDSGITFDLNENKSFYAASLFKIPLDVAVLKEIQQDNLDYNKKITYLSSDYSDGSGIIAFSDNTDSYTVKELLSFLLKYSDNIAQNMLRRNVSDVAFYNAFSNVIENSDSLFFKENWSSAKEISNYFEEIYKGDYLDLTSKKILFDTMKSTAFDDRITQHLDSELEFSHKIGNWPETGTWHDCGIIFNDKTVSLCVMSEGATFEEFLEVSKLSAEFINELVSD